MLQWIVIGASQLFKWSPDVWGVLSHEDLSRVGLPTKVDLLCIDLVRNVDQQHVEEVVRDVIWLEYDLNFVRLVRWDGPLLGDHHEGQLLLMVLNTSNKAVKVEVDREGRDILDLERLL